MEHELWNLKVKDFNISPYTQRFNELVLLCLTMVSMDQKKIEAYIRGLCENIKGDVTSSKPAILNEAVRMAHTLMEQKAQAKAKRVAEGNTRKQGNARAMTTAPNEGNEPARPPPVCNHYDGHHFGRCSIKCHKCGGYSHKKRDCRVKVVASGANAQQIVTCFDCGERGHVKYYRS
ncbi:putative reverse transcriptase domain-containing protein [Tanacetum coccineum]